MDLHDFHDSTGSLLNIKLSSQLSALSPHTLLKHSYIFSHIDWAAHTAKIN